MGTNELLTAIFAGGDANDEQLGRIRDHIAAAGFDPSAHEFAGRRLAGVYWRNRILAAADRLRADEAHYLKHVIARREWPIGTTFEEYLHSVANVVRDPRSGIFTSLYRDEEQIGFFRNSENLRGPDGMEWVLVEYQVSAGHWKTAFQPIRGLDHLNHHHRGNVRWLKHGS